MKNIKKLLEESRTGKEELILIENLNSEGESFEERIKEIKKLREKAEKLIVSLPIPKWRLFLHARYIEGKTYRQIAEDFYVEERTVYRNIKKGIEALEKLNKKSV